MRRKAQIINVKVERTDAGLFRATSPEVKGLHVASQSVDRLPEIVRNMISDLFRANGEAVNVYEVEAGSAGAESPWVVIPAEEKSAAC